MPTSENSLTPQKLSTEFDIVKEIVDRVHESEFNDQLLIDLTPADWNRLPVDMQRFIATYHSASEWLPADIQPMVDAIVADVDARHLARREAEEEEQRQEWARQAEARERQAVRAAERATQQAKRQRQEEQRQRLVSLVRASLTLAPDTMVPSLFRRSDGPGLIYPGRVHSIAGESESGKTWIALHIAKEFIEDSEPYAEPIRDAIGIEGPQVLYLDYDSDESSIDDRVYALGIDAKRLVYKNAPDDDDVESMLDMKRLDARSSVSTYGLVIIDNVTAAMESMGLRGISNEDVSSWFRAIPQMMSERGITVVLLDHLTKANDGTGRYAIGGVQKLAALSGCQFIVDVKKPLEEGAIGQVELRVTKDRPGKVRPVSTDYRDYDRSKRSALFILDSEAPGELEIRVEPPEERKHVSASARDATDERLIAYVKENPGCTVRDLLTDVNKKHETLNAAIARQVDAGMIRIEIGARGSHKHFIV